MTENIAENAEKIAENQSENEEKKEPVKVSPRNGVPLPHGRRFDSETAKEAGRKSAATRKEKQSIARAFKEKINQVFEDGEGNKMTGAEIIAQSIIKGANNGNAKMVEIALSLLGEKPAEVLNVNMPDPTIIDEIKQYLKGVENDGR